MLWTFKNLHASAEDFTRDPSIYSLALYHVAIKAGFYRKAVHVYDIPNQYTVTYIGYCFLNVDPALTMTLFMAWSTFAPYIFIWDIVKQ